MGNFIAVEREMHFLGRGGLLHKTKYHPKIAFRFQ